MSATLPIRGRGARSNATGRFESLTSRGLRRRLDRRGRRADAADHRADGRDAPRRSSPPTTAPTSASTGRSIPTGAASTAASTATPGRPTPTWACRRAWISRSKLFFKPEAARAARARAVQARLSSASTSTSAATPTPTSRSSAGCGSPASILEVLDRFNHPFSIITKSDLIVRDVDILGRWRRADLAAAVVSITTLDRKLARSMEPRAATPGEAAGGDRAAGRGRACRWASASRPCIPGLNDHEMEAVLERAAAGRARPRPCMWRCACRWRSRTCSANGWQTDQPGRAAKVMSLVRQMRGGKDYDADLRQAQTRRRSGGRR